MSGTHWESPVMPSRWKCLRSRLFIASIAFVAAAALIVRYLEPVSEANLQRIHPGMSETQLHNLLGRPEYETVEVGLFGHGTYVTNPQMSEEEQRQSGFQEYRRQQWISTEITIIVLLDSEGHVVCRYSREGRPRNPLAFMRAWLSRLSGLQ